MATSCFTQIVNFNLGIECVGAPFQIAIGYGAPCSAPSMLKSPSSPSWRALPILFSLSFTILEECVNLGTLRVVSLMKKLEFALTVTNEICYENP